jgi:hypothetical protein
MVSRVTAHRAAERRVGRAGPSSGGRRASRRRKRSVSAGGWPSASEARSARVTGTGTTSDSWQWRQARPGRRPIDRVRLAGSPTC